MCCVRVRVCFQRKRFHHAKSRPPCAPVHRRLRFRAVWGKGLGNTPGTQEGMEWERPQERPRSFGVFVQACWPTMKHSEGMCGARSEEGWKFTSIRTKLFSRASAFHNPVQTACNDPNGLQRANRSSAPTEMQQIIATKVERIRSGAWLPVALGGAGIANSDLMLHRQVPRVNVALNKRLDRFGDHKLRLGSPKRTPLASLRCAEASVSFQLVALCTPHQRL